MFKDKLNNLNFKKKLKANKTSLEHDIFKTLCDVHIYVQYVQFVNAVDCQCCQ